MGDSKADGDACQRLDVNVSDVPRLVAACCTLHNICEIHGDTFDEEWLEGVKGVGETDTTETGSQSVSGESIRQALMAYFQHHRVQIEPNTLS